MSIFSQKFIFQRLRNFYRSTKNQIFSRYIIKNWELKGRPVPPPHPVKQQIIREYQQRYGCRIFVETGTYLGDMIMAQKGNFDILISIELSLELWQKAVNRFLSYQHIYLKHGDSGVVLHDVTLNLTDPAIFWLDGHYSGDGTAKGSKECPIFEEIDAILNLPPRGHVILVDDARLFIGENDYPTKEELLAYVRTKNNAYSMTEADDIIRFVPVA